MHLLRDQPQVEEKLRTGDLNISVAAQAQACFRNNDLSDDQKTQLIENLDGKSSRQAARAIAEIAPKAVPDEKTTPLTKEYTELRIVIDEELRLQIEQLKALLSHAQPGMKNVDLLRRLVKMGLKKYDKSREPERPRKPPASARAALSATSPPASAVDSAIKIPAGEPAPLPPPLPPALAVKRERIPTATNRALWQRDGGACVFTDPIANKRCGSKHFVQSDHIVPVACGGTNELTNLRLLCHAHNTQAAIEKLGREKMELYMKPKTGDAFNKAQLELEDLQL